MPKPKIVWEYFIDPLGSNLDVVGEPNLKDMSSSALEDDDGWDEEEYEEDGGLKESETKLRPLNPLKVLHTNFGVVTIGNSNAPDTNFCRWVGHTNFDITETMVLMIEKVPGVEALEVFSRYRFRVNVGKLFSSAIVKSEIQKVLLGAASTEEQLTWGAYLLEGDREKIKSLRDMLAEKWKFWSVLLMYNGNIEMATSNEENEEYKNKKEMLVETCNKVGGFLFDQDL